MSWQLLVEFVVSIAYGVLSSLIPIFNSEIYIVASQVGGFAEEATTAVGCAVGVSIIIGLLRASAVTGRARASR